MKNLALALLFLLVLGATALGLTGHARAVALRSETDVSRPTVKLSDVFEGLPEGIDCDIARAPQPGKSITYDVNVLQHLVQQYKLDWQPQSLADHTVITTIGTKITADDIRPYIVQKVKDMNIKGDIDVLFDSHMLEMTLPSDKSSDLTVNNFSYDTINKRFHADLFADGFNGPINLPISGHVTIRHDMPVLAHRLEAGTVIGAADIDWLSVPEDRTAGAITNADQLIGRELQRDTDAGVPMRGRDVIAPRLVVRGALVTMKIETQFMTVTAQGRALQDGKRGDVVRVTNTQSNRVIEGVVEGSDVVRVLTIQKIASASAEDRQE